MSATILRADARSLPLADNTVDLIVTSPPYLNLRAYQDGGAVYDGQIGNEPTREQFIDSLLDVTRECVRVLKPSGSLWVNLGDSYRDKSLQLTPHRYAARCVDDLGLILRAEVCWSKPNGLPESVTDRVRRSHEFWFHFTREPRYFSAVDEVREAFSSGTGWIGRATQARADSDRNDGGKVCTTANPLGKLPGSVWEIPTQPLQVPAHLGVDHFAAFPMEWPRRIIRGWSPRGICTACGEGRRPVTIGHNETSAQRAARLGSLDAAVVPGREGRSRAVQSMSHKGGHNTVQAYTITGYTCACVEQSERRGDVCAVDFCTCDRPQPDCVALPPTRPAVVLDPFGGTGTTALVASALGRTGISVDRSQDYSRLARWRTTDPGQRAAALQVQKPAAQVPGQLGMFDDEGAA